MKKIFLLLLACTFLCSLADSTYSEENYGTILKKIEKAIQNVGSYQIKSESAYNGDNILVDIDFVKPGIQRQTVASATDKKVHLYVKDKHYLLVPGTTKWAKQEWQKGNIPISDLGVLGDMLEWMKKENPPRVELRTIENIKYIVLTYENVPDWGNAHYAFQKYKSNIRLYLDSKTYLPKLTIVEMSGEQIGSGKKTWVHQKAIFESYNKELNLTPPAPGDIFVPEPVSGELPKEIFKGKMADFKNSIYNVSLKHPESWFIKEYVNPGVYQLFISKEKVDKPGDIYLTGISIIKIADAKKTIDFKSSDPAQIADEYLKRYVNAIKTSKSVVIGSANTPIKVGKDTGYKTYLTFTDEYGRMLSSFLVMLYKNDTFVSVLMESTHQDFSRYSKMYADILTDMTLF